MMGAVVSAWESREQSGCVSDAAGAVQQEGWEVVCWCRAAFHQGALGMGKVLLLSAER